MHFPAFLLWPGFPVLPLWVEFGFWRTNGGLNVCRISNPLSAIRLAYEGVALEVLA